LYNFRPGKTLDWIISCKSCSTLDRFQKPGIIKGSYYRNPASLIKCLSKTFEQMPYKGIIENRLSKMGFKAFHALRPGYIYPVTPRKEPNFTYRISRFLYPLIKLFGSNSSIQSTELAASMFKIGLSGSDKEIFENKYIMENVYDCQV